MSDATIVDGGWNIAKAVFERLDIDGVGDTIKRRFWGPQGIDPAQFKAVAKYRAKAGTPLPYAVFRTAYDTPTGGSSAGAGCPNNERIQYREALIQFFCYSKPDRELDAIRVASLIRTSIERGKLDFSGKTKLITLTPMPEIEGVEGIGDGDDGLNLKVVQYQIDYEIRQVTL